MLICSYTNKEMSIIKCPNIWTSLFFFNHCLSAQVSKVNKNHDVAWGKKETADPLACPLKPLKSNLPTWSSSNWCAKHTAQRRSQEQSVHLAWHLITAWAFLRAPESFTSEFHQSTGRCWWYNLNEHRNRQQSMSFLQPPVQDSTSWICNSRAAPLRLGDAVG